MHDRDASQPPLRCYRCGASLEALSLPLSRMDLCPECGVELHVCRMCEHYAPSAPDACDEEDAVAVRDKAAANFCDYFMPDAGAFDGKEQRADAKARAALDALFGRGGDEAPRGTTTETDDVLKQAEDLFRK